MQGTFNVRGRKVRTGSHRRYIAVLIEVGPGGGAGILKRSDSIGTMRMFARETRFIHSSEFVIIDTTTGQEVQ